MQICCSKKDTQAHLPYIRLSPHKTTVSLQCRITVIREAVYPDMY